MFRPNSLFEDAFLMYAAIVVAFQTRNVDYSAMGVSCEYHTLPQADIEPRMCLLNGQSLLTLHPSCASFLLPNVLFQVRFWG